MFSCCGCGQSGQEEEKGDPAYGEEKKGKGAGGGEDEKAEANGDAPPSYPPPPPPPGGASVNGGPGEGQEDVGPKKVGGGGVDPKMSLLSIRARRALIRDAVKAEEPTKFDDDDDVAEEDEDGDETHVIVGSTFCGQDYERLKSRCLAAGKKFVDPEFPPCDVSLFFNSGESDSTIEWKRPGDIEQEPRFFVGGASRFDVKQGEIGDCWLLAAIANLTMHKKLFQRVVPHDQSFVEDYAGIFHFRFWRYGEWVDVVVDDLLPTRYGRLIYMRSETKQEFWSALMEKAYAKLHGSYLALRGGTTCEAMVDFSGGCGESYATSEAPEDVFNIMMKASARSSMQACSVEPDPAVFEAKTSSGLVRGHAYSLTKVVKAKVDTGRKQGLFPLIRIRNPWGNDTEWKGAWSDGSMEWKFIPEEEKGNLGLTFDEDGEFYMSQKDFMQQFDTLEICHLGPDAFDDDDEGIKWHESRFNGAWVAGRTAGGCRNFIESFHTNPQFKVVLTDSDDDEDDLCTCIISLMQKGSRRKKAMKGDGCLTIGFAVYRLDDPDNTAFPLDKDYFKYHASTAKPKAFINLREVSGRFKLQPGTYVIIPSTFQPDEEGDFLLRVFSEKDTDCTDCVNDCGE